MGTPTKLEPESPPATAKRPPFTDKAQWNIGKRGPAKRVERGFVPVSEARVTSHIQMVSSLDHERSSFGDSFPEAEYPEQG